MLLLLLWETVKSFICLPKTFSTNTAGTTVCVESVTDAPSQTNEVCIPRDMSVFSAYSLSAKENCAWTFLHPAVDASRPLSLGGASGGGVGILMSCYHVTLPGVFLSCETPNALCRFLQNAAVRCLCSSSAVRSCRAGRDTCCVCVCVCVSHSLALVEFALADETQEGLSAVPRVSDQVSVLPSSVKTWN